MPPCASMILPVWGSTPVATRARTPKSSDSSSSDGMAEQLMATNGDDALGPEAWIIRAISSLPVPVSPMMSTVPSRTGELVLAAANRFG